MSRVEPSAEAHPHEDGPGRWSSSQDTSPKLQPLKTCVNCPLAPHGFPSAEIHPSYVQAWSQHSADKLTLFPPSAQFGSGLVRGEQGVRLTVEMKGVREKSGIKSFSVHAWHLRHSVLELYTATGTKIH